MITTCPKCSTTFDYSTVQCPECSHYFDARKNVKGAISALEWLSQPTKPGYWYHWNGVGVWIETVYERGGELCIQIDTAIEKDTVPAKDWGGKWAWCELPDPPKRQPSAP